MIPCQKNQLSLNCIKLFVKATICHRCHGYQNNQKDQANSTAEHYYVFRWPTRDRYPPKNFLFPIHLQI